MKTIKYILFIIASLSSLTYSQVSGLSPKTIALGSAATVVSRNVDASGINPANLADNENDNFVINLLIPNLTIGLDNNIFDLDLYNKYFTGVVNGTGTKVGRVLTESDKQDILNRFPSDGKGRIDLSGSINNISLYYYNKSLEGGFSLTIKDRVMATVGIPRDAFKLILYGIVPNTVYDFSQASTYAIWLKEYALGFGKKVSLSSDLEISAGINIKYYTGIALGDVRKFNTNVMVNETGINNEISFHSVSASADFLNDKGNYSPFGSGAGSGIGFDIGGKVKLGNAISFAVSMTDLGTISWNKNVEEIIIDTTSIITDVTSSLQTQPFETLFERHKNKIGSTSTTMPLGIHLGAGVELDKLPILNSLPFPIMLVTDLHYISNQNGESFILYSLGAELKIIKWLPIRLGLSVGTTPFAGSFGFGINTGSIDFDLGLGNVLAAMTAKATDSFSLGLGMKIKF